MKPILAGGIIAVAIIAAFVVGAQWQEQQDTAADELGEAVDALADSAEKAAERATN